jgi:hypothetical protein
VLIAIREDLARLETVAALSPPLDSHAMIALYPASVAAQEALGRPADELERLSQRALAE